MASASPSTASVAAAAVVAAVERSMGVIEFKPDGTIVRANDRFLASMGYTQDEIRGQHHRLFVKPEEAARREYRDFWGALASGAVMPGRFERIAKDGRSVWLEANYNPILDDQGRTIAVLKLATDITGQIETAQRAAALVKAIDQSQAMIEFDPQGRVLQANPMFLQVMGYSADELADQHHWLFAEPAYAASDAYRGFWSALQKGASFTGEFKRLGKGGREVWFQASYSPMISPDGKVIRVVKVASDITEKVHAAQQVVRNAEALEAALAQAREAERVRDALDRALQEMSTPVTPIWDEILLLPLFGVVDSSRTDDIMRKTLTRISETRSKVFILDISGVPSVDTAVANQLIKITKSTRLMGCETIISGLSPAIAQTMVTLGVDVSAVRTTAALRDAFRLALRQVAGLARLGLERDAGAPGGNGSASQ